MGQEDEKPGHQRRQIPELGSPGKKLRIILRQEERFQRWADSTECPCLKEGFGFGVEGALGVTGREAVRSARGHG